MAHAPKANRRQKFKKPRPSLLFGPSIRPPARWFDVTQCRLPPLASISCLGCMRPEHSKWLDVCLWTWCAWLFPCYAFPVFPVKIVARLILILLISKCKWKYFAVFCQMSKVFSKGHQARTSHNFQFRFGNSARAFQSAAVGWIR